MFGIFIFMNDEITGQTMKLVATEETKRKAMNKMNRLNIPDSFVREFSLSTWTTKTGKDVIDFELK